MEHVSLRGLIIREIDFGDHDRYVTVLTEDGTKVEVLCRGVRRKGARQAAAMRLFCWSEMQLYAGRGGKLSLNSAEMITSFWNITSSMEGYALCCYFSELASAMTDSQIGNPTVTRLFLYALRALTVQNRDRAVVKAAFELRLMAESGFQPQLSPCDACTQSCAEPLWFSVRQGTARCNACVERLGGGGYVRMAGGALAAMVHILTADISKVYNFALANDASAQLARLCEDYALFYAERGFDTLKFYHQLENIS